MAKQQVNVALIFFCLILIPMLAAGDAPPSSVPSPQSTPTPASSNNLKKPIPVIQKSSVFKKGKAKTRRIQTSYSIGSSLETPFHLRDKAYYDRLNAELSPTFLNQPTTLTETEKVISTMLGTASTLCAGAAAAQCLGLLPSGNDKKKKQ